jgi:hypothetical protein
MRNRVTVVCSNAPNWFVCGASKCLFRKTVDLLFASFELSFINAGVAQLVPARTYVFGTGGERQDARSE